MSKITFDSSQSFFLRKIKEKTDRYFAVNNLRTSGNANLYFKSIIQVLSAIGIYIVLIFFNVSTPWALLLCVMLGINLAVIGFNVMHEGSHQSFSSRPWINTIAAYFLNILGGNALYWKIKHNVNHHTYTNIEGLDSDIDVRPFMRLHPGQPKHWFHRFQHIYWVFLYGVSYLAWIFYDDFVKYFSGKIAAESNYRLSARDHFVFWSTKIMYVGMYVALPIVMVGWAKALIGFGVITFVCGLTTSIVFQLAHIVEDTIFTTPDLETTKINHEWAIHQVTTTSNFATKSKFFFWLLGGLNFQIEHHLFPKISHVHYPQISRIVKEVCEEYNIVYNEYSTMYKALVSHWQHLRRLGTA